MNNIKGNHEIMNDYNMEQVNTLNAYSYQKITPMHTARVDSHLIKWAVLILGFIFLGNKSRSHVESGNDRIAETNAMRNSVKMVDKAQQLADEAVPPSSLVHASFDEKSTAGYLMIKLIVLVWITIHGWENN